MCNTLDSPEKAQRRNRISAEIKTQMNNLVLNHLDNGFIPTELEPTRTGDKVWLHLEREGDDAFNPQENHISLRWEWLDTIMPLIQEHGHNPSAITFCSENSAKII